MVSKLRNVISELFDGQDVMIGLNESLIDEKEDSFTNCPSHDQFIKSVCVYLLLEAYFLVSFNEPGTINSQNLAEAWELGVRSGYD